MLLTKRFLLTAVLGLVTVSLSFATETYKIDPSHSAVGFSVKHLVISNTKGEFNDFSGVINLDEKNLTNSSVEITIHAASVDTRDEKRDNHLRSPDFLSVEEYPEITFKSTAVKKKESGHVLVGDLTIRGTTKQVEIPFDLVGPVDDPWGNKRIGAEGRLTINRHDFGVSWSKTLDNGGLVVGDDVKIELQVEAMKTKEGTN